MVTSLESEAGGPEKLRISLAAAMTLGLEPGMFYRDARLGCINLLLTHPGGCIASCAYCGLTRDRAGEDSKKGFIRVRWPTYALDDLVEAMVLRQDRFSRICISMITRRGSASHVVHVAGRIRERMDTPVSGLLSPTVTSREDLRAIREAGVDRVGIAVDAATPELFDRHRGKGVKGPHLWDRYWKSFDEAVVVFGEGMVGCHLIVGLGETERQMAELIQHVRDVGGCTHLFSFFPEPGSPMQDRAQPPVGQYRRIQVARHLIDEGLASAGDFVFDGSGRITSFGVDGSALDRVLTSGTPFRTSGCPGRDGEVACNRPFANSRPGPDLRNYPFALDPDDVTKVIGELWS